jgi:hypothetical protein
VTQTLSRRGVIASLGAAVIAGSSASRAHHSTSMFDLTRTVKVQGTIEQFEWTNPHTWIWLNVQTAPDKTDRWGIEGMSPNYLNRIGWTHRSLKPGDKVTAEIYPLKDGRNGGFCASITLPDGKVLRSRPG